MRAPGLLCALLLGGLAGCEVTPDPCEGYRLACLGVTVEAGPPDTYQLLVVVDSYSSTSPLTPRSLPDKPLAYPMRFAIHFGQFDSRHKGQVTVDISALGGGNEVRGQVRQTVPIDNMEKRKLSIRLGDPLDLRQPLDLRPGPDLGAEDLLVPADLADGGGGN